MSASKPASAGQLSQKAGTTLGGYTKVSLGNGNFTMVKAK